MLNRSSVGLLHTGAGAWAAELLGLAPPGVSNEQAAVVLEQEFWISTHDYI
jgi:hypothetical protein